MMREWYGAAGFVLCSFAGLWIVDFPLCILPAVLVISFTITSLYSTKRATGILLAVATGIVPAYVVFFELEPERTILVYSIILALFFMMEYIRNNKKRDIYFFLELIIASGYAKDERRACEPVIEIVRKMFPEVCGNIALYDSDKNIFRVVGSFPRDARVSDNYPGDRKSISLRAYTSGEPQIIDDVDKDPNFVRIFNNTRSEATVPIISRNEKYGVLNIESPKRAYFSRQDVQNLTILASVLGNTLSHLYANRDMEEAAMALRSSRKELALALQDSQEKRVEIQDVLGKLKALFVVVEELSLEILSDSSLKKGADLLRKQLGYSSVYIFARLHPEDEIKLLGNSEEKESGRSLLPYGKIKQISDAVLKTQREIVYPFSDSKSPNIDLNCFQGSLIAVPIAYSGTQWGSIVIGEPDSNGLSAGDLEVITVAAVHLALLLKNLETLQRMELEISRLEGLHKMIHSIRELNRDSRSICRKIVEEVSSRFGIEKMVILLLEKRDREERLVPVASNFMDEEYMETYGISLNESVGGLALRALNMNKVLNIADTGECSEYFWGKGPAMKAVLEVPLVYEQTRFGVMSTERMDPFSEEDEKFFAILGQYLSMFLALNDMIRENEKRALVDHLTGLGNRRYLFMRISEENSRIKREGTPVSVMMVDLADFKYVNDIYGHLKGDKILQAFARAISGQVRDCDVAGRYGGDEFLIIFPCAGIDYIDSVRDRICDICDKLSVPGIPSGIIKADAGYCTCPDEAEDLMEAVHIADQRMYAMKRKRKSFVSEDSFEI